jgi:hypothetical protein
LNGANVTRSRAADDFGTIGARLRELQRERADASPAEPDHPRTKRSQSTHDADRRAKERRDGAPPPWVPTIFFAPMVER